MKAAIITIGDEILLGQITDTNSRYIAQELASLGIETAVMYTVADSRADIINALQRALSRAELVLITGGLGPTKDDLTKKTLADFFSAPLEFNPQVYAWLEEMLLPRRGEINAYNKTQAYLPKGCRVLRNRRGTASGMWFEKDGKVLVSLPGVPFETEYLVPAEVLPRLKEKFHDLLLRYRMVTVYDIPEAELAMKLAAFEKTLTPGLSLAYLPSAGFVRLRLTAKGAAVDELDVRFETLLQELKGLPYEEQHGQTTEEEIARRLRQAHTTVACAESCTGGNIAHLITSVPGASAYFLGGVVSYSNEVKKNVLGVRSEDLEKYGAVSEAVAVQMAQGARRVTGAQWAVSTTGIAGPDGGTPEKPVGTVWIGVAGPNGAKAQKFVFSHTRERNIGRASVKALQLLLAEMERG